MGQAVTITPDSQPVTITPDMPEDPSFLQRAATQPSQFSHLNPLRYFDELGEGMAQGAEMIAHPVDTAQKTYKFLTTNPNELQARDMEEAKKPLPQMAADAADTLAQSYGQAATVSAAGKTVAPILSKGAEVLSDTAKAATDKAMTAAQNVTPKQVAQGVGAAGGALAGKGILSPVLAGYGLKLGKVAELILGKDRANSPIFKSPELSLDDITDALADTIAQDRQRFTEQQASGLGKLPQTGAKPASQTGEALAGKPVSGGMPEPPTTGGKTAPRFTTADRAAAKSLLQDALAQSTKDVVDQALPNTTDAATKLRTQSQVDLALQQGDVPKAEAALKQANPEHAPRFTGTLYSNRGPEGFEGQPSLKSAMYGQGYYLGRTPEDVEGLATRPDVPRQVLGANVTLNKPLMWDEELSKNTVSALADKTLQAAQEINNVTPEQAQAIKGATSTYELRRAAAKVDGQLAGHFINQGARALGYDGIVTDGQVIAFNKEGLSNIAPYHKPGASQFPPSERLPVLPTSEIRARLQSQAQTPKGFADVQNDNQVLDAMRYDLNRHGWSAESEARREFIARNSTGMTKGELGQQAGMVGAEPKPVKLTKTPGVNTTAPGPDLNDPEVLRDQMQKTLDAILKKKQQK